MHARPDSIKLAASGTLAAHRMLVLNSSGQWAYSAKGTAAANVPVAVSDEAGTSGVLMSGTFTNSPGTQYVSYTGSAPAVNAPLYGEDNGQVTATSTGATYVGKCVAVNSTASAVGAFPATSCEVVFNV